jgi:chemotaxis protein MotA
MSFITGTLRAVMNTTIAPHERESLISKKLAIHQEEVMQPSKTLRFMAYSPPGLGIVATMLGVVINYGKDQ